MHRRHCRVNVIKLSNFLMPFDVRWKKLVMSAMQPKSNHHLHFSLHAQNQRKNGINKKARELFYYLDVVSTLEIHYMHVALKSVSSPSPKVKIFNAQYAYIKKRNPFWYGRSSNQHPPGKAVLTRLFSCISTPPPPYMDPPPYKGLGQRPRKKLTLMKS